MQGHKTAVSLFLLNSTEQSGRHFDQNPAAVHLEIVIAHLCQEQTLHICNCSGGRLLSARFCENAVVQGCCQLVWYSSTEEQGRQFTLNTAAVHWCLVTAHLYAEWIFKGVSAVAQTWCQLVWHSSTEEQGRQFTLNQQQCTGVW